MSRTSAPPRSPNRTQEGVRRPRSAPAPRDRAHARPRPFLASLEGRRTRGRRSLSRSGGSCNQTGVMLAPRRDPSRLQPRRPGRTRGHATRGTGTENSEKAEGRGARARGAAECLAAAARSEDQNGRRADDVTRVRVVSKGSFLASARSMAALPGPAQGTTLVYGIPIECVARRPAECARSERGAGAAPCGPGRWRGGASCFSASSAATTTSRAARRAPVRPLSPPAGVSRRSAPSRALAPPVRRDCRDAGAATLTRRVMNLSIAMVRTSSTLAASHGAARRGQRAALVSRVVGVEV